MDTTNVMERIQVMANVGLAMIEERERQAVEAEAAKDALNRAAWLELEERIRHAFEECVRPFVTIIEAHEEPVRDWISNPKSFFALIHIEGFAPVRCFLVMDEDGSWRLGGRVRDGIQYKAFEIPEPFTDPEYGVVWQWRYAYQTSDLQEALGYAFRAGQVYRDLKEARAARHVENPQDDAELKYEPVDEQGNLMDGLAAFVRGIVDERLEQRGVGD